jgi:deoxyribose-phosphate aldolase
MRKLFETFASLKVVVLLLVMWLVVLAAGTIVESKVSPEVAQRAIYYAWWYLALQGMVVASVIGFPHGAQRPEVKALESRLAVADGARELDMVMNVGALKSGDEAAVRADIAAVVGEAKPQGVVVKVILETCYLTPAEIATACRLAESAGADFVKTSTGFGAKASGPTGATPEAVQAMLDSVGGRLQVKASGGIRTWDDAVRYLDMGCTRIGVGDAVAILDGGPAKGDAAY